MTVHLSSAGLGGRPSALWRSDVEIHRATLSERGLCLRAASSVAAPAATATLLRRAYVPRGFWDVTAGELGTSASSTSQPQTVLPPSRAQRGDAVAHGGFRAFGSSGSEQFQNPFVSGVAGLAGFAATAISNRAATRRRRRQRSPINVAQDESPSQEVSLEDYPVHGPCFYWSLGDELASLIVYVPIGHDVIQDDVVFGCTDGKLRLGMIPEMGGVVIDDELLYQVDSEKSSFRLDVGLYGEKCLVAVFPKKTKEWYSDDSDEHFLTRGDKARSLDQAQVTHRTFLDVAIDGEAAGRIVVGLWGDLVPRTAENFRCLCTGEKGVSKESGKPLHYKGTSFHRVIPGFCVQAGETFENSDGSGGESIYGSTFEDENFKVKFKRPGQLAMANSGPDSNGSQFVILTSKAEHLNHMCVGFGQILEGYDVVEKIEALGEDDWYPGKRAMITDCGELPLKASVEI